MADEHMNNTSTSQQDSLVIFTFFLIPTLMLLSGLVVFPYPQTPMSNQWILIPLFLGLALLGSGVLLYSRHYGHVITMIGWGLFTYFWANLPSFLYYSEGGDIFNAAVCVIGVYVLNYMGYHEWLSWKKNEEVSCLRWIAGGTFVAGTIYFLFDVGLFPALKAGLIETVAAQSAFILQMLGFNVVRNGSIITFQQSSITIIFACTAIQAMVLFIGMIIALQTVSWKRKILTITVTVVPIYFLNLVRNASVIYLVGSGTTSFHIAHNILAKIGALLTLIALLFLTFKLIPELYDEIMGIMDLPKRRGPLEALLSRILKK